ncbi:MAG TPA: DoxX family membrane protein [Candidatus Saccharimonadales bacterium]|nr:DoxX family membrane protein [Candidatus Saccharimonadales bacterium]
MSKHIQNVSIVTWLLRIGLAFVFLYACVSSLEHPLEWVGFLPSFLTKVMAATTTLKIFAGYELLLGIWVLSGKFLRYSSVVCALTLAGIVILNFGQLITTFRDVGLVFMALALYAIDRA